MSVTAKAQHTPGPWMYKATAGHHDFAIYPEATGRDLALVRDFDEANARLIAAAPELLGALRAVVEELARHEDRVSGAMQLARVTIAKAEGAP
jgi:N-acetylglucosamine-6-phosphate deacetylase